jgi:hypothetical protein
MLEVIRGCLFNRYAMVVVLPESIQNGAVRLPAAAGHVGS